MQKIEADGLTMKMASLDIRKNIRLIAVGSNFPGFIQRLNTTNRIIIPAVLMAPMFDGCLCTKEFDCEDMPIQPALISFQLADIDTLSFRKFKPNDDLRNLTDTIVSTYNDLYRTSNDTTKITRYQSEAGIKPGFEWQLFIPALNKTTLVSDIRSNNKLGGCGERAVGSACACLNDLFSAKQDNQVITFSDVDREPPFIYGNNGWSCCQHCF